MACVKRITGAMKEWGRDKLEELNYNPYSDTNILERYRWEGNIQRSPPRDKILCYDPKGRKGYVNDINRAWKKLPKRTKECIIGKFVIATHVVRDDGKVYTAREVANNMEMSLSRFNEIVSRGVRRINSEVGL